MRATGIIELVRTRKVVGTAHLFFAPIFEFLFHGVIGLEGDGFLPGLAGFVALVEGGVNVTEMIVNSRIGFFGKFNGF